MFLLSEFHKHRVPSEVETGYKIGGANPLPEEQHPEAEAPHTGVSIGLVTVCLPSQSERRLDVFLSIQSEWSDKQDQRDPRPEKGYSKPSRIPEEKKTVN